MNKGLIALTIVMAVIFAILLLIAIKMDMRPQDYINHILPTRPTETQPEDTTAPDITEPDDTVPEETTKPNQQGSDQNSGNRPPPTESEESTAPEETIETEPTTPPTTEPDPTYDADDWETPEF